MKREREGREEEKERREESVRAEGKKEEWIY